MHVYTHIDKASGIYIFWDIYIYIYIYIYVYIDMNTICAVSLAHHLRVVAEKQSF